MEPREVFGILSNWDKIEAEIREGIQEDYGKSKNLQDIINIIHELQSVSSTNSPLRDLFESHIKDTQNPHDVNVTISDLDMIKVLYDLYGVMHGAKMTLSEFAETLVRIKRFATKEDVDNNTNTDAVVDIDVLEHVIERHDLDPDSHSELLRYHFPGVPPETPPSYLFDPILASHGLVSVERNTGINYHDINGRVEEAEPNTVPVDYSYGIAAVPIFGPKTNFLVSSQSVGGTTIHGGRRTGQIPFVVTPADNLNYLAFTEDDTIGKKGFVETLPDSLPGPNIYYVYCHPFDRRAVQIDLFDEQGVSRLTAKYHLEHDDHLVIGEIHRAYSDIQILPNGWVRVSLAYDPSGYDLKTAEVNILKDDPDDDYGVLEYQGSSKLVMGFWQHQLTEGSVPVPPIFTTYQPETIDGTRVSLEFTDWFNPVRGTLFADYISPMTEMFGGFNQVARLGYNDYSDPDYLVYENPGPHHETSVELRTDPINQLRNQVISYNVDGGPLVEAYSKTYSPTNPTLAKKITFSYTTGYQGFGFTDEAPLIVDITGGITLEQMNTFFTSVYDDTSTEFDEYGVIVMQLYGSELLEDYAGELETNSTMYESQYRINDNVNILEIGYNSITDQYLEGYMINFRYYSIFANWLNIEFLLGQYIPQE